MHTTYQSCINVPTTLPRAANDSRRAFRLEDAMLYYGIARHQIAPELRCIMDEMHTALGVVPLPIMRRMMESYFSMNDYYALLELQPYCTAQRYRKYAYAMLTRGNSPTMIRDVFRLTWMPIVRLPR